MKNSDLVRSAVEGTGLTLVQAANFRDNLVTSLRETLLRDGVAELTGIGKFKIVKVAARKGRNPSTGDVIDIPEKNKVRFTPAKTLKDAI